MEALDSLSHCNQDLFDLIIVNDGSTDEKTIAIIAELKDNGYRVIEQSNQGLGAARNAGIRSCKTKYFLPLDADNKVLPDFFLKGIKVMEEKPHIAVVYGNARLFGDAVGILSPGEPNLQRMMLGNYIDACALIRREVFEKIGYYDQLKIMGYEDWDLWLRFLFAGYKFHYIDEILFEYRVRRESMIRSLRADCSKQNMAEQYILNKFPDRLDFDYPIDRMIYMLKKRPFYFLYFILLRKYFPAIFKKKVEKGKLRAHFLYD